MFCPCFLPRMLRRTTTHLFIHIFGIWFIPYRIIHILIVAKESPFFVDAIHLEYDIMCESLLFFFSSFSKNKVKIFFFQFLVLFLQYVSVGRYGTVHYHTDGMVEQQQRNMATMKNKKKTKAISIATTTTTTIIIIVVTMVPVVMIVAGIILTFSSISTIFDEMVPIQV